MKITKTNPFTHKEITMDLPVTQQQIDRWEAGELIQTVMPNLTAEQREFLISGTTPPEWDRLFPSKLNVTRTSD